MESSDQSFAGDAQSGVVLRLRSWIRALMPLPGRRFVISLFLVGLGKIVSSEALMVLMPSFGIKFAFWPAAVQAV